MMEGNTTENLLRVVRVIFVTACALICLIPAVGLLWADNAVTGEEDLAEYPSLIEGGVLNTDLLSDLGDWFEDHFAYRSAAVSVNASLRADVLGVSATDEVVVGSDGWLYYYGTIGDYCGYTLLSERAIDNIVFNLELMQAYTEANGASFVVAFAPNKNSLYNANMPYYYLQAEERNLTALEEALSESSVSYVSLYDFFAAQDEVLYYQKDTHWNTTGARLATAAILSAAGKETAADTLFSLEPSGTADFVGDLNTMLYPASAQPEEDDSYDADLEWSYLQGESVEDTAVAASGGGSGTLLMYRDSFANNMIPFLADVYETSYFTKLVPYDLTNIASSGADTVIIERAERNLADLGTDAVIIPAGTVSLETDVTDPVFALLPESCLSIGEDGDYAYLSGVLPDTYCSADVQMYIGLEKADGTITWYEPLHLSTEESDYGYAVRFYPETFAQAVKVYLACTDGDETLCLGSADTGN